jgi:hypothetical protein
MLIHCDDVICAFLILLLTTILMWCDLIHVKGEQMDTHDVICAGLILQLTAVFGVLWFDTPENWPMVTHCVWGKHNLLGARVSACVLQVQEGWWRYWIMSSDSNGTERQRTDTETAVWAMQFEQQPVGKDRSMVQGLTSEKFSTGIVWEYQAWWLRMFATVGSNVRGWRALREGARAILQHYATVLVDKFWIKL